ncbi:uncharacterized protein LOC141658511 [Silene latifolia]|uniref:uncharacterized protein LOC141658511 n=1 Tax=Silene latifolia TaxID=37657 RepID=UPI003D77EF49
MLAPKTSHFPAYKQSLLNEFHEHLSKIKNLNTNTNKSNLNTRNKSTMEAETETTQKRHYWLLKTEPGEWSWEDQSTNGGKSKWDGVKNKQAQKHLKSMKLGDLCFFYHSGSKCRRVVGVVEVVKEWYEDDDGGIAVDVAEVGEMRRWVDLAEMKADERVNVGGFELFRQPRLSVVSVGKEVWERVCELGGGYVGDGRGEDGEEGGD